jgi:hypothetical protein
VQVNPDIQTYANTCTFSAELAHIGIQGAHHRQQQRQQREDTGRYTDAQQRVRRTANLIVGAVQEAASFPELRLKRREILEIYNLACSGSEPAE